MEKGNQVKIDYSSISGTYDRYRSYPQGLITKIGRFGEIQAGTRVLDVGCGTGNVSSRIREMVDIEIIGLDKSLSMLEAAAAKGVDVVCADADYVNLPFRPDSFDTVVAAYVIQHIENLGLLLGECYRVLREGFLVLLTSSHKQIESQHPVISEFSPGTVEIEKARFTDIPQIENLLREIGFKDVDHAEVYVEGIPIDLRYLEQVKNKFVSTYHLLPQSEFEEGVKRLEAFVRGKEGTEHREWRGTVVRARKAV
ncbi:MAG: methyltransferase domain-containing protein [Dehalococcoidia bacterium]